MSIRKNTWNLDGHYDLTKDEQNTYSSINAGSLYIFGDGSQGRSGLNTDSDRSSPVQIPGGSWTGLSLGNARGVATKSDNTLWLWGTNQYGELGLNSDLGVFRSSPVQLPGTQWNIASKDKVGLSDGGASSFLIKTDGTLWGMGINSGSTGLLGLNDTVARSSPTQIPGTQWSKVSTNRDSASFIKTDNTLWMITRNADGYERGSDGQNDAVQRSSPVQVPGTNWKQSHGGWGNWFATKTDGTLWAWGNNNALGAYFGLLGLNDTVQRSSPTQIPGTQWNEVKSTAYSTLSTKTDGTLWVWGKNLSGEFGLNDVVPRSSPTQVPGTNWSLENFECGRRSVSISKTDGTLWVWGLNGEGELGLNDIAPRSSPHQIPGTNWNIDVFMPGDNTGGFIKF